ncbi:hypothetical protein [Psychrobacter alimentarius]|uniref:hypothetical protein n=1 Tax=Psychrobacter alimentarius TaxID=261164 RepID=UPI0019196CC0|nr:hypothetical protein [Psychrobacter alimentarius]
MNSHDVFVKTDLGRDEIKSQGMGTVPREARTLLIMIDGKRDYQSYLDALDQRKMFAGFGGITSLLELLLTLEYIEIVSANRISITTQAQSTNLFSDMKTESAIDRTFNHKPPKRMKAIGSIFKTKLSAARYENIKSDLAVYIEKNASAAEAWGYLLLLEQCVNNSQLLFLAREIQRKNHGDLSLGMTDFIERIEQ